VPNFALFDEFLFPDELASLQEYVWRRECRFRSSAVVVSRKGKTAILPRHRRSRVLSAGPYGDLVITRLRASLDHILEALGLEPFPLWFADAQITASGDGDFFGPHTDSDASHSRWLTYVYYFHREPKRFRGGELLLYRPNKGWAHDTIVPRCNQMVVFRPSLLHEVRPVRCPVANFADSRFTLNGWMHREPATN
jgi:SM-20-related protein